jgi:hypothetical protein
MVVYLLGVLLEHVDFEERVKAHRLQQKLLLKTQQINAWNKGYEKHAFMYGARVRAEKLQFVEFMRLGFVLH